MDASMKEKLLDFSDELNKRMTDKGVTYRQVALAARVTRGSMIHYKSGNSFPELYTLVLMAEYLDCSVDDLLGYKSTYILGDARIPATSRFRNKDEFADYIRIQLCYFMNVKAVNAEELSNHASISVKTIDMYLSVHRWVPRTVDFLHICEALKCTPSELLGY